MQPSLGRVVAMLLAGVREYGRDRVLSTLPVAVPSVFNVIAVVVMQDKPGPLQLVEGARRFTELISVKRMHDATMGSCCIRLPSAAQAMPDGPSRLGLTIVAPF